MQPRNPYQGTPASNMSFPTEAYMAAAANAAKIQAEAQARMGEQIGAGLQKAGSAIGGAIGDYKKMQSQVKADAAAFDAFKDYLPPEVASKFDAQRQAIETDPKASLMDKQQFYQSAKGYLGAAIGQKYKMDQINAETAGRVRAAQKPPLDLSGVESAIDSIWNPKPTGSQAPAAVVPVDQSMPGQDTTQPATDLAEFLRRKGWSGRGPVPESLMREFKASQPFPEPF
jgi:Sec-independent protein translocase protein TatA